MSLALAAHDLAMFTRGHQADVPEPVKRLRDLGDISGLVRLFGGLPGPSCDVVGAPPPLEGRGRGGVGCAIAGLVSIPTSEKPRATLASKALFTASEALSIDTAARRLSRLRMQVGVSARFHCADDPAASVAMVTLTYAGTNADWSPRHISSFLDHCRKHMKSRGHVFRYVWVAELQRRGVIHYHVAVWLPPGLRLPKPDDSGWWPHGITRIEFARNAVPYLLKYLSKDASKSFGSYPPGARLYGVGGLSADAANTRRWLSYPAFVQARSGVACRWSRHPGGGWRSPDGVVFASEFARVHIGGRACLLRVFDHGRPFPVDGPYSAFRHPGCPNAGPGVSTPPAIQPTPDGAALGRYRYWRLSAVWRRSLIPRPGLVHPGANEPLHCLS